MGDEACNRETGGRWQLTARGQSQRVTVRGGGVDVARRASSRADRGD